MTAGELRVLIVDDELLARKRLNRLAQATPGVVVIGLCDSGEQALELIREEPIDVVLLDIQMPGLSGLDISGLIPDEGPRIIFTTAHPEHALDAFGVGAADYLLKPIAAGRLRQALDRVRQQVRPPARGDSSEPLGLPTRRGIRLLRPEAIFCGVFDGTALKVHTADEQIFVDATLRWLEQRLSDPPFVRVHRRVLLNLDQVTLLSPLDSGGYRAQLHNGVWVEVSRKSARALRRRLGIR